MIRHPWRANRLYESSRCKIVKRRYTLKWGPKDLRIDARCRIDSRIIWIPAEGRDPAGHITFCACVGGYYGIPIGFDWRAVRGSILLILTIHPEIRIPRCDEVHPRGTGVECKCGIKTQVKIDWRCKILEQLLAAVREDSEGRNLQNLCTCIGIVQLRTVVVNRCAGAFR